MKRFILAATLIMSMIMTGCGSSASDTTEATTAAASSGSEEATEGGETASGEVSAATQAIIDKGVLTVGSSGDLYACLLYTSDAADE